MSSKNTLQPTDSQHFSLIKDFIVNNLFVTIVKNIYVQTNAAARKKETATKKPGEKPNSDAPVDPNGPQPLSLCERIKQLFKRGDRTKKNTEVSLHLCDMSGIIITLVKSLKNECSAYQSIVCVWYVSKLIFVNKECLALILPFIFIFLPQ